MIERFPRLVGGLKKAVKRSAFYRHLASRRPTRSDDAQGRRPGEVFDAMASWIASASPPALDVPTAHHAKRAVLDATVSLLLGLGTREGRAILDFVQQSCAPGKCRVPGTAVRLQCALAAYAGTALCQVHDANDGHPTAGENGASYHPGRVIVPAALALGQEAELTGQQLLIAVALGYDIALGTHHGPLSSPPDAYGAAASACYAFGLGKAQTAFALRIAGFSAPRSGAEDFETNNLTCAQQTRSGVEAAVLVRLGYPVSRSLDVAWARFDFRAPAYLGKSLHELYFKPYPSCRDTHYFIEAALALRPKVIHSLASIKAIRIYLPNSWRGPAHRMGPGGYFKSYEFSTSYCALAALVDGEFGPRQLRSERTDAAVIQGLQDRVSFIKQEVEQSRQKGCSSLPSGTLELVMEDGTVHSQTVSMARGEPENPLMDEELAMKLVRWTSASSQDANTLLDAVMSLDQVDNTEGLTSCLHTLGRKLAP